MLKQSFLLLLVGFLALATSCTQDEDTSTSVENYVTTSVREMTDACKGGKDGCFELVFPITIIFPDSTTATVDSLGALKSVTREWKKNNPGVKARPEFVFPISVINSAGELITVASKEELKVLADSCKPSPGNGGGNGGGHGDHKPCFTLNFPITIVYPDGTTAEASDAKALATLLKEWKKNNPKGSGHPELQFPITVTLEDGTTQTVATKEELKALKEACRG